MLSISFHSQYSYYCDYSHSYIYYIAYLLTLRGEHRFFLITIKTCKCAILKLGLFWFDLSHRYLYALLIFSLCGICNSERCRVIVGCRPTPVWNVREINFRCYAIQLLPWLLPFVDGLYRILFNITGIASRLRYHHKNCKCDIYKLVILRFDLSHPYLYALLIFISMKYAIQKNTGWFLVIFLH